MSEKPILFNTEMVQAILNGRKTCTRRIIKRKYSNTHLEMFTNKYGTRLVEKQNEVESETFGKNEDGSSWQKLLWMREIEDNPAYQIGDILYVRETWCDIEKDFVQDADMDIGDCKYIFKVDDNGEKQPLIESCVKRWRPSIHMPKEAARIFLKVTAVRVERLQDITDEGAKSEGSNVGIGIAEKMRESAIDRFKRIWDSTVKRTQLHNCGWNSNPWVWVINFERIERSK